VVPDDNHMQPIHIDEFATLASANGVKVARPLLTRFLDEQVSEEAVLA
jgi:hypothetical protein